MTVKMRWHDSPHSLYHVMEHEMSIYIYMSGEGRAIFFFFFFFNGNYLTLVGHQKATF